MRYITDTFILSYYPRSSTIIFSFFYFYRHCVASATFSMTELVNITNMTAHHTKSQSSIVNYQNLRYNPNILIGRLNLWSTEF